MAYDDRMMRRSVSSTRRRVVLRYSVASQKFWEYVDVPDEADDDEVSLIRIRAGVDLVSRLPDAVLESAEVKPRW
ncbi:MAG: hypothetical protein V3T22_10390 [Planctomycetota bacterium]